MVRIYHSHSGDDNGPNWGVEWPGGYYQCYSKAEAEAVKAEIERENELANSPKEGL